MALVIALVIVIIVDLRAIQGVRYLYRLWRQDRTTKPLPSTWLTLTFVKLVVTSGGVLGLSYLLFLTALRVLNERGVIAIDYAALSSALTPLTLGVFVGLFAAVIVDVEYLKWRRSHPFAEPETPAAEPGGEAVLTRER